MSRLARRFHGKCEKSGLLTFSSGATGRFRQDGIHLIVPDPAVIPAPRVMPAIPDLVALLYIGNAALSTTAWTYSPLSVAIYRATHTVRRQKPIPWLGALNMLSGILTCNVTVPVSDAGSFSISIRVPAYSRLLTQACLHLTSSSAHILATRTCRCWGRHTCTMDWLIRSARRSEPGLARCVSPPQSSAPTPELSAPIQDSPA